MIKTQFHKTIQVLRSDNGGEFVNNHLQTFFRDNGILHQTACPYTPQQNGVAERKNRHILETARALLFEAQVPPKFWSEAVATSIYLINRLPSRVLNFQSPLHTLSSHHTIPSFLNLPPKIFGCTVYVHIPKTHRTKLDPCALKCVFFGYGVHKKGYRCFDPISKRLFTTMDCTFLEEEYFFPSPTSSEGETTAQSPPLPNWLSQEGPELDHSSLPESTPELGDTDHLVQSSISTSQPEPDTVEYPEEHTTEVCESELSPGSNNLTTEPISLEAPETGQYVLPPRNNRGIPPRRYDPEFEAARSRYLVANVTRGERLSPQLVNLQKNICSE